ncbi:EAL domain-containing protein [Marinobacter adhaerens]|uniref:EAL domain-containing protein n=1 Tax=Marinobacter adhaerens TaxID=1033846 RepID=UPI003C5A969C|nr:EAL domain-containing protein [Marinobacter adhaerens]|eukprot:TRINITY_DN10829_c0_g1_i1.p1 TRINITY_DN10829_c0_g1~~TRINITY_DN10829_c0_g1_i1.p1  ORF type:complete len:860 (-),score=111.17 TRINITY_DN10829_c0_g1_i1:12497-15076(-)
MTIKRYDVASTLWLRLLITLLLLSGLSAPSFGAEDSYVPQIEYLRVAPDNKLTVSEALASDSWQTLEETSPNFGYIRDTVWLRFPVSQPATINLLEVRYSQLDKVTFHLLENGRIARRVETGDHVPFEQRPILHRHFLFPFEQSIASEYQILLEVHTEGAMQIPVRLWNAQAFFEHSSTEDQMHSLYYGILITVIFFNLFIFAALREPVYLLYVLSTLGYLLLIGSLNGSTFQFLWPDSPALQNQIMLLAVPFSLLFTLVFSRSFLKLTYTGPVLNRLVLFMISVNAVVLMMTFFLDYSTGSRLTVALAIPSCLLLTVLGPVQWWKGNPQASYYTVAWAALTVGSAITAANKYGFLPNNFLTTYGMQIGSALEAILLTLALAARIYQERQDKVDAREAELNALAARRSAELKLMDHALHNPLTGLPNRSSLEMMLNDLMLRSPERRYGVAVIHLNNLQSVTKTLGHRNSDRILALASKHYNAVARELPGALPIEQSDQRNFYLASLDPQTFAFVVDADATGHVPRAILKALEGIRYPIDYLGMQIPLDPALGVAIFPEHGTDANTLIRRAVIAEGSDSARERGIAYYKSKKDSYSADRLTLVSELRHALNTNELALFMQPKQSLKTGRIVGIEVLIRWPGRATPLRADEIVSLAEQTGLIKPMTRWVLEQSLELRSRLLERGWPLNISINISPNNLREPDFPIFVQRLMSSYHSHRGAIIFEVTETSMMQDPANSLRALNSLSATGIPVSIDDFGSGYSSLSYIKQLPASEVKIDRSLVTELNTEAEDRVIVQTTIDMCHSLGYQVVAEGVEDEVTANLLRDMGCDMIQGYLLTPPLPFDEMMDWLDKNHQQPDHRKLG